MLRVRIQARFDRDTTFPKQTPHGRHSKLDYIGDLVASIKAEAKTYATGRTRVYGTESGNARDMLLQTPANFGDIYIEFEVQNLFEILLTLLQARLGIEIFDQFLIQRFDARNNIIVEAEMSDPTYSDAVIDELIERLKSAST